MAIKSFGIARTNLMSTNPIASLAKLTALSFCALTAGNLLGQPAPLPDPKFWITDGPIDAILPVSNTVYLGGEFTYVGPPTGPVASFDQTTGALAAWPSPMNGIVKAVVTDGVGGWFIGGTFTKIGQTAITNVAHLRPDLSLDTGWDPRIIGTTVNALARSGTNLFIGGQFSRVGGQALNGVVGVDTRNAGLFWTPQFQGTVNAMAVSGDLVYLGGNFFSAGNSNVQNLAAISISNSLATAFNPLPDQQVFSVVVSGNLVYAGGPFTTIGTKPRNRLAALDAATGVANNWNPNPNGIVRALVVDGTSVYVGGDFTTISGQNRRGFAVINTTGSGTAQALNLQIQSGGTANLVRSLSLVGNSLYLGGQFTNVLGELHPTIAGVDVTTGLSLPVPLGSEFNGAVGASFGANAIAAANNRILFAGEFQSAGGVPRKYAAALSLTSGAVLPWDPSFNGPVLALAQGANKIYAGGSFTNVNTTNAENTVRQLAAVDPVTGAWNPNFVFLGTNQFSDVVIRSIVVNSNTVYVGGAFTVVGSLQRRMLAALDPNTGAAMASFNAQIGGGFAGISTLVLAGSTLYAGGDFSTVNSVAIPRLAAFASDTGASVTSWNPSPNQPITAMAATADTLYVGGSFSQIGGVSFKNFAAFNLADNSLAGVDASLPTFASGVTAIGATPTVLYVGGFFNSIGGEFRQNLGSLASFNASSYEWDPSPDVPPTVIALTDDYAFIGGPFRSLGQSPTNRVAGFLATFNRNPQFSSSSITPAGNIHLVTTTGDRTDMVIQAAPQLNGAPWTNIATNDAPGFSWSIDFPASLPQRFFRGAAR